MPSKRYDRIARIHVGPFDLLTSRRGAAARLVDNRLTRRIERAVSRRRKGTEVENQRVTRETLDQIAATNEKARAIVDRVRGLTWYHTIDLGEGVETPGFVDHRAQLGHYGLPASTAGMRCLDIATFDGFWAFEFERRGATDVVAIDVRSRTDIDCPRWMLRDPEGFGLVGEMGKSFKVAHDVLHSKVQRVEKSVYDLDPAVDGMFDLVIVSDLLLHLRDPQLALERAYSVCRGKIVVADVVSPVLDSLGDVPVAQFAAPGEMWWILNAACIRQMMVVAGFDPIVEISRFVLDATGDNEIHKIVLHGTASEKPPWTERLRTSVKKLAVADDLTS